MEKKRTTPTAWAPHSSTECLDTHRGRHASPAYPAGQSKQSAAGPGGLAPSSGPVYLEGRLVLSLSFQGCQPKLDAIENDDMVLESYRLWDELSKSWHEDDLGVLRFENADVVMRLEPRPTAVWTGELDTHARVILVPDLDAEGFQVNQACDLCWKRT